MKIASVISFCTNDYRYLKGCIEGIAPISSQIIIPVCDHFFDGTPENFSLLEKIYAENPHCQFIEFAFDSELLYGTPIKRLPQSPDWGVHWHNTSRLVSYYFLNQEIDYVLFCDVDELFDKEKLALWFSQFNIEEYDALRFSTYWYFREACFQATTYPDGPLLVKKERLTSELLLNEDERMGMFLRIQGKKQRIVPGLDGKPMVHHYSWVRTKAEMLKKVRSWAHHWERNWEELIEEEYSRDFNGTDFVRKYEYQKVKPFLSSQEEERRPFSVISLEQHRQNIQKFPHVAKVDAQEISRKEIFRFL